MKTINYDYWIHEIDVAKKSAKRGYVKAAVARLARMQRKIEKEVSKFAVSNWNVALIYQLIAGIYDEAGDFHNAHIAYLKAATVAFRDVYFSIDMMTNSLWAAEESAQSLVEKKNSERILQVRNLNHKGSRFTKVVGDMLNDQLIDAGLAPVIFGGAYPAKVALIPEQHRALERFKRKIKRGD